MKAVRDEYLNISVCWEMRKMPKDKQAKQKERERKVAQKKLAEQKAARDAAAERSAEKKSKTASLVAGKFTPKTDSAGNKKDPLVKTKDEL